MPLYLFSFIEMNTKLCLCTVKSFQWSQFCFIKSCDLTTHFKSNKNDRWQFIEYKVFYNVNMHGMETNDAKHLIVFILDVIESWSRPMVFLINKESGVDFQSSLGVLWHQFSKRWKADCKIVTVFTVCSIGHYIDCTVNWTWKKFNCEDVAASLNTWAYYVWLLTSLYTLRLYFCNNIWINLQNVKLIAQIDASMHA